MMDDAGWSANEIKAHCLHSLLLVNGYVKMYQIGNSENAALGSLYAGTAGALMV